jgi:thiamine-phosphate pyrophosphorylase
VTGLYAITADYQDSPDELARAVRAALNGGARIIQYRRKSAPDPYREASLLLTECRAHGVPLIINDDVELAEAIGADGVHLGKDDTDLAHARARLGAHALIGVSCYDSLQRAVDAQAQGADYVAFGRFFPSRTKPHAPCARLETLRAAGALLTVPIVAIGGITVDNASALLKAGAHWLAVIDAIFGTPDPEHAARAFTALFETHSGEFATPASPS